MTTIYTLPACPACLRSKAWMTANGIEFKEVDLTQDPAAFAKVVDGWGYQAAPVIESGETHWSGHNIERLKTLV